MGVINEDLGICDRCGKDVHLPHDPPCEHGICICDTCDPAEVCPDCRTQAVADMFATGTYSEAADPLFDRHAHQARRTDWTLAGFDPSTNSWRSA